MRTRREGRELALQFLYQLDINKDCKWEENFESFFKQKKLPVELFSFIKDVIEGTIKNIKTLDSIIQKYAENWDLNRITIIDRNILRIAIYEMFFLEDIPAPVSINEAVDIAKKFSTIESGKFVNGILDEIKKKEL